MRLTGRSHIYDARQQYASLVEDLQCILPVSTFPIFDAGERLTRAKSPIGRNSGDRIRGTCYQTPTPIYLPNRGPSLSDRAFEGAASAHDAAR
jgi:hypothetical protein